MTASQVRKWPLFEPRIGPIFITLADESPNGFQHPISVTTASLTAANLFRWVRRIVKQDTFTNSARDPLLTIKNHPPETPFPQGVSPARAPKSCTTSGPSAKGKGSAVCAPRSAQINQGIIWLRRPEPGSQLPHFALPGVSWPFWPRSWAG